MRSFPRQSNERGPDVELRLMRRLTSLYVRFNLAGSSCGSPFFLSNVRPDFLPFLFFIFWGERWCQSTFHLHSKKAERFPSSLYPTHPIQYSNRVSSKSAAMPVRAALECFMLAKQLAGDFFPPRTLLFVPGGWKGSLDILPLFPFSSSELPLNFRGPIFACL